MARPAYLAERRAAQPARDVLSEKRAAAARAARRAETAGKAEARRAELAARIKPFEADVAKARAALQAFDRRPERQALVDAFREARERLAEARRPHSERKVDMLRRLRASK